MKNLILLLSTLIFIVNCKSGDSEPTTLTSIVPDCDVCGDFIEDDKDSLSVNAKALLDSVGTLNTYFTTTEINERGEVVKTYPDSQMLFALRAYVHSTTTQSTANQVCDELSQVYDDFGISNSIVYFSGTHNSNFGGSTTCMLEVNLPNATIAVDPILNRSYIGNPNIHGQNILNADQIMEALDANTMSSVAMSPDGFLNPQPDWVIPSGATFIDMFADSGFNTQATFLEFCDDVFQNLVK